MGAVGTVLQTSILLTAACVITSASMGGGVGRIPQRGGEYRIDRGGRDERVRDEADVKTDPVLLDRLEKVEEKVDMLLQVSTLHALAKAVRMCCGVLHVRCLLSSALEHARPLSVLTAICPHLRPSCHKIFCKDDLVSTVVARLLDVRRQTPHQ